MVCESIHSHQTILDLLREVRRRRRRTIEIVFPVVTHRQQVVDWVTARYVKFKGTIQSSNVVPSRRLDRTFLTDPITVMITNLVHYLMLHITTVRPAIEILTVDVMPSIRSRRCCCCCSSTFFFRYVVVFFIIMIIIKIVVDCPRRVLCLTSSLLLLLFHSCIVIDSVVTVSFVTTNPFKAKRQFTIDITTCSLWDMNKPVDSSSSSGSCCRSIS